MPSGRIENLKVQAMVFVGDAMEEEIDDLCHAGGELGVPALCSRRAMIRPPSRRFERSRA